MTRKVISISADDTLRIVHEIMELGRVRHLPVVRGGRLVGVVSQRDLFHASLSNVIGIPRD
jgi:CBS domain-containing protein